MKTIDPTLITFKLPCFSKYISGSAETHHQPCISVCVGHIWLQQHHSEILLLSLVDHWKNCLSHSKHWLLLLKSPAGLHTIFKRVTAPRQGVQYTRIHNFSLVTKFSTCNCSSEKVAFAAWACESIWIATMSLQLHMPHTWYQNKILPSENW